MAAIKGTASDLDNLAKKLDYFRQREDKVQTLLAIKNQKSINVIAAWNAYTARFRKPVTKFPRDDAGMWRWCWSGVQIDADTLAGIACISHDDLRVALNVLYNSRLIYPDGSVTQKGLGLMRSLEAGTLPEFNKPKRGRPRKIKF
jgi:hypothetical protein